MQIARPVTFDTVQELEERLEELDVADSGREVEVDLLNALGWALVPVDVRRTKPLFARALELSESIGYELGAARAKFGTAYSDFFTADYGRALTKTREAATILKEQGEPRDIANVLLLDGLIQWSLGDFEVALDLLHRCLEIATAADYGYGVGWVETSLGSIFAELGDLEKSIELQKSAISRFRDSGHAAAEGRASSGLGMVYVRQGRYDEALDVLERGLELNRSAGSELSAARTLNDMGAVHEARGEPDRAEACLSEALEIRERYENWPAVVTTLLALGKLHNESLRPESAAELLGRAVVLAEKIATRPKLWQAHAALSKSYELRGLFREALEHQRLAQSIQEEVQGEEASTKLKNLQIRHEVETSEHEAELQRLRNVELAGALEQVKLAQSQLVQSEKMAAVGSLVAGVAHELNNPVAALSCGTDVQLRAVAKIRERLDVDVDRGLERALEALTSGATNSARACERIATMVRSLQSFSQLDHSEFQRVDIREGIESTIALVRAQWGNSIEWVTRLQSLPSVECYPGALNQALMTLLVNAVESIESAGTITVSAEVVDGVVRLRVRDTGRGIDADKINNLFEIGFNHNGERVRMTSGLANVRATVEKHHGRISVDSEPGRGTSFVIDLPLRQPTTD